MLSCLKYLPARSSKPRATGLTIVIDTGLSVNQPETLISAAEPYIDLIKLAFGIAPFAQNLERNLMLYRNSGIQVFFGGTLFEAFVVPESVRRSSANKAFMTPKYAKLEFGNPLDIDYNDIPGLTEIGDLVLEGELLITLQQAAREAEDYRDQNWYDNNRDEQL